MDIFIAFVDELTHLLGRYLCMPAICQKHTICCVSPQIGLLRGFPGGKRGRHGEGDSITAGLRLQWNWEQEPGQVTSAQVQRPGTGVQFW